ncbi:MAG: hypothetical protein H7Z15_03770 [Rhizobacter sp.]|nr:hypothetical protein [Rhizobacter sp.]
MQQSALPGGVTPTYYVFHRWLSENRRKVAAGTDRTVIYSGMDSGRVPLWRQLRDYENLLSRELGKKLVWEPIQEVLTGLPCKLKPYQGHVVVPEGVMRFKTMWDFACGVKDQKFVTEHESQQIWKNLSAWYVKNAVGEVYIFKGSILKKYPDMLLAEIPVLMKNRNVSTSVQKKIFDLIPESRAAWERYRADSEKGRLAGR